MLVSFISFNIIVLLKDMLLLNIILFSKPYYYTMESTTTYLLISAVSALLLGILKIMYSSKCSKINCCFGAVDITRDIESEVIEDKYRIDHPQTNTNIPSLNIV